MVFWASVVSDDSYQKYRIYRSYTKDFKTFSAPELYIEEPNAVMIQLLSTMRVHITDLQRMRQNQVSQCRSVHL